jgi:hypothetical protein
MNKDVLTAREAAFVAARIAEPPVSDEEAARIAGYKGASKAAARLLAKPHIIAALRAHRDAAFKAAEIDIARVLKEIGRIAFSNIQAYFGPDNAIKPMAEISEDAAAALAGFDTGGKPKLWDKPAALEKLMQRLNAYPPTKAPIGPDGNAVANVYITVPAKSKRGETASG